MKNLIIQLFAIALLFPACTTRYYIVRHAERLNNTPDSPLSSTGNARAVILRDTLQGKKIKHIFASTFQRTQQTAQPLATALSLDLKIYRPDTTAGLVSRLKKIRGNNVLVVGHSNTVPDIVEGLSGQTVAEISEDDFDNLFIVKISRILTIRRTLVQTTYGPPSP